MIQKVLSKISYLSRMYIGISLSLPFIVFLRRSVEFRNTNISFGRNCRYKNLPRLQSYPNVVYEDGSLLEYSTMWSR